MRKTKVEKLADQINERFRSYLDSDFFKEFSVELETTWSIIDMALVSNRKDRKPLTKTQHKWIKTWAAGYEKAMRQVRGSL